MTSSISANSLRKKLSMKRSKIYKHNQTLAETEDAIKWYMVNKGNSGTSFITRMLSEERKLGFETVGFLNMYKNIFCAKIPADYEEFSFLEHRDFLHIYM